jgi:hypothetical protein
LGDLSVASTSDRRRLGHEVRATRPSDGHGGTLVGDPPLAAMTDPSQKTLLAAHAT